MNVPIPPRWGEFVGCADDDVIAFAVLWVNSVWRSAFFHAQQAIEKYLKALVLSLGDPLGEKLTARNTPSIMHHKLVRLAEECAKKFPYYAEPPTIEKLRFFAELKQGLRYPWVERVESRGGLTLKNVRWFEELVHHLRNDIPIVLDNYALGTLVRGYAHQDPSEKFPPDWASALFAPSLAALRATFRDVDGLVRWPLT